MTTSSYQTPLSNATPATSAESGLQISRSAKELKQMMQLGLDLPDLLLQTDDGRPYEAFGLTILTKQASPAAMAQQVAYLKSAQAQGGHEAHVKRNQQRLRDQVTQCLTAFVVRAQHEDQRGSTRAVLSELMAALRADIAEFEHTAEVLGGRMAKAQKVLDGYRWAGGQAGITLNPFSWLKAVVGSAVDYRDAVAAFNQREDSAAHYDAQRAAAALSLDTIGACERLQGQLQLIHEAAVTADSRTMNELQAQLNGLAQRRTQDFCIDAAHAADALLDEIALEPLLAKLMTHAQSNGVESVFEYAGDLAIPLVSGRLKQLDVPGLIGLELASLRSNRSMQGVDSNEALHLAGKGTLDILNRRSPVALLCRDARARSLRVQLTANGQPVFKAANMNTAAFRYDELELALGEAFWEIALDELQTAACSTDALKQGRQQREFFAYAPIATCF